MTEGLDKAIDTGVPEMVERLGRRLLYAVFWLTTAVLAYWFLSTGLVYGAVVIGAPLLLLGATRLWGLGRVHPAMLGIAALAALVPAFFLGKYQADDDGRTGLILVGYLVFLVWGTAYPAMLDKFDERFQLAQYPSEMRPRKLAAEHRDGLALFRVLLVKLWMAVLAMLVVDASVAATICLVALLFQRHWTAALAGLACLAETVVELDGFTVLLTFEPLEIVAGLAAALPWLTAVKTPLWDKRIRREAGW
jgi:hypothetical protein